MKVAGAPTSTLVAPTTPQEPKRRTYTTLYAIVRWEDPADPDIEPKARVVEEAPAPKGKSKGK
jgi:hypothetical protein